MSDVLSFCRALKKYSAGMRSNVISNSQSRSQFEMLSKMFSKKVQSFGYHFSTKPNTKNDPTLFGEMLSEKFRCLARPLDFNNHYYKFKSVVFSLNIVFFKNMHTRCQKVAFQNIQSRHLLKTTKKQETGESKTGEWEIYQKTRVFR